MHTNNPIYFDHASSTPVHPDVIKGLTELTTAHYANSESLHQAGLDIQTMMRKSREAIAVMLKVKSDDLYFTSGATESNNLLIKGIAFAYQNKGKHLITSRVEHSSVLDSFQDLESFFGFEVTYLNVDQEGRVRLDELEAALRPDTTLVSIMAVNNEVGTIMPIEACAQIIRSKSQAVFHVDCVQALTKIDFNYDLVDCASFSAHKINGVKGSGLLYKKRTASIVPLINGGQQENGLRGGTSNACVDIVLAKTMRKAIESQKSHFDYVKSLNDYLREQLSEMDNIVINSPEDASPFILNISCPHYKPEVIVHDLETKGI